MDVRTTTKDYLIQFKILTFYTFLDLNALLVAADDQGLTKQMAMVCIPDFQQIVAEQFLFERASNLDQK